MNARHYPHFIAALALFILAPAGCGIFERQPTWEEQMAAMHAKAHGLDPDKGKNIRADLDATLREVREMGSSFEDIERTHQLHTRMERKYPMESFGAPWKAFEKEYHAFRSRQLREAEPEMLRRVNAAKDSEVAEVSSGWFNAFSDIRNPTYQKVSDIVREKADRHRKFAKDARLAKGRAEWNVPFEMRARHIQDLKDRGICPTCEGSGQVWKMKVVDHGYCGGSGTLMGWPCGGCGGLGWTSERDRRVRCGSCGGSGQYQPE